MQLVQIIIFILQIINKDTMLNNNNRAATRNVINRYETLILEHSFHPEYKTS